MKNTNTLDIYHHTHLSKIKKNSQNIKKIEDKILHYTNIINEIENKRLNGPLTDKDLDKQLDAIDNRLNLTKQLSDMKNEMDETNYYVNTSDILFKYYDLVEKGNVNSIMVNENSNSILRYFTQSSEETNATASTSKPNELRGSLLDNFISKIDKNYINNKIKDTDDICSHCGSLNITTMYCDGYIFCNECSTIEHMIVDHDKPSYKDPPKEISYFSYKRINHLNEWLNQIQGKETTEIPEELYDKILMEIKKQRITNMADLSYDKVRCILKQLKVHKYYEHIPHIINRLNGLPMPNFSLELEEKLRIMFKQIQTPFLKHSPPNRKNFLSYSYVLHKFLQLLEKDEYLGFFQLLKSRDKLAGQDRIWKKICEEIGWQFIPSL